MSGFTLCAACWPALTREYDRALRSFERMAKLNPAERVVVSYNRARVFMYQRRWEDAIARA